ncbi:MAG: alpha/beta hydrolase [Rhizobacter sp.]|nr:alpha/beta hydrolase [Rhizobacter sp.]
MLMSASLIACAPLGTLNALTPSSAYALTEGVPYGEGPRQRLDVYRPDHAAPPGGWPVVVFFYGGSWNNGERRDYRFIGEALAARGVLTLIPDYRLYPEVRYPDFLDDSARALAWGLREAARLGGNPRRVFVMGHSAGAYNAAMLALDARWLAHFGQSPQALAGWVGLAGPYDFLPIQNPDVKPVFFHPHYPPGTQPLSHASRAAPPTFLGAARDDSLVNPQRNTVQLSHKLEGVGVPVTLRLYDRVDHATLAGAFAWPLRWMAPVLDDVVNFVTRDELTLK